MKMRRSAMLVVAAVIAVSASGASGAAPQSLVARAVGAAGTHVVAVAVADFNADGIRDLAVADLSYHGNDVRILLGRGDGVFTRAPGSPVKLAAKPGGVLAADLDGDGNADLAVRPWSDLLDDTTAILLGDGAGGLRRVPGSPLDLTHPAAVADVNHDGKPDVVGVDGGRLGVALGDGAGRFAASRSLRVGIDYPAYVVVEDFNGDGQPDLAVGGLQKDVAILLGTGSGRFAAARKVTTAGGALVAADFTGDGKADLVVAGKTLGILLGDGAGGFRPAPGGALENADSRNVVQADVDGDHRTDLVVGRDDAVEVLLGNGAGRFRRVRYALPFDASVVAATDVTGDGKVDVVVSALVYGGSGFVDVADEAERPVVILSAAPSATRPRLASGGALTHGRTTQRAVRGAIARLAADGGRAAVMVAAARGHSCLLGYRVVTWNASSGGTASLDRLPDPHCSRGESFGTEVAEFAVGGDDVAWITVSEAGNTEGWHDVFTASASGGQTRRIAAVRGRAYYNAEEGTWAGHLFGGGVVAYNVWETACDPPEGASCAPDDPWLQVYGARIVRARAGRGVVAKRGAVAYRLAAVGGGRMAVASTDRSVTVLSSRGTRLATTPGAGDLPLSTALGGTHLAVVRWNRTLDLYNARTGAKTRSLPLAEGAPDQLVGLNRRLALLERSRRLVLVRLADGRHLSLTPPPHFVGATLTARGLFYAYNVPRAHGGRIAFEPTVSLLKRF